MATSPLPDQPRPVVAITTDLIQPNDRPTSQSALAYASCVHAAGALPILLPPIPQSVPEVARRFDAFVFTGGDDPATEPFGVPTHPKATLIHPTRQRFETALLLALAENHPDTPVLGICLGMQMMALVAGGKLNQHLPDTHECAALHWDHEHPIAAVGDPVFPLASGLVMSRHRQAVSDPGSLEVCATASDSVIEGIHDPDRAFYLGVQWHPERTGPGPLGQDCFDALVSFARERADRLESTPTPASP
ncbi:MAG: gamma-glutamyl-gamma-aminobutyrate hydrolase family protein [Phycisphaerales bacterium]